MPAIMSEEKKEVERVTLKGDTLRKCFPASYTSKRMEEILSGCWNIGRGNRSVGRRQEDKMCS